MLQNKALILMALDSPQQADFAVALLAGASRDSLIAFGCFAIWRGEIVVRSD